MNVGDDVLMGKADALGHAFGPGRKENARSLLMLAGLHPGVAAGEKGPQDPPDLRPRADQSVAADIATAIDTFVKSGTVSVTVATTGSATAQTGSGTGSIS